MFNKYINVITTQNTMHIRFLEHSTNGANLPFDSYALPIVEIAHGHAHTRTPTRTRTRTRTRNTHPGGTPSLGSRARWSPGELSGWLALHINEACNVAVEAKITFQSRCRRSGRPRVRADRVAAAAAPAGAAYCKSCLLHCGCIFFLLKKIMCQHARACDACVPLRSVLLTC